MLLAMPVPAKNSPGSWKTYLSCQVPVCVAETPNRIFAVYKGFYDDLLVHNDGALFSYSPQDNSVETYSPEDGLNDTGIKLMTYSPEMNVLVLVYDNSNIDLFYGRNNVVNISDIVKWGYLDFTVNSIAITGKLAYLSAAFGIVEIDLERQEVKNTFKPGANVMAVCQWEDYFYAATAEGLKRASKSSNLMNPGNWKLFPLNYGGNPKRIEKMRLFNDHLVFYDGSNTNSYYLAKDGTVKLLLDDICRDLTVLNEQLIICGSNSISFYTDFNDPVKIDKTAISISSYNSSQTYWIVQPEKGLTEIKKDGNTGDIIPPPNSPLRNYNFFMTYTAGKLLVVGGQLNVPTLAGTFMIYENGKWINFDNQAIAKESGLVYNGSPWCRSFTSVTVDPRDSKHYFVGSFWGGIYEFQDTIFVKHHSDKNTNNALQTVLPNEPYPGVYVRTGGVAYDRNNNLYTVNTEVQNGLSVLTNDNRWKSFYYPEISNGWMHKLLITRDNRKWIAKYTGNIGIFVLDDNNTVDNTSDDICYYSASFVDQQGEDIKAATYSCLAEDLNGIVWVGTDNGPVSFSSVEQVGRGECNRIISTDKYNAGYRPLEGEKITAIAVDGGNRKWMGTDGNGVFVVDNSGETLQVEHFNTGNSKIISDKITSIAINNQTGEVFIGTNKGIVSYMSEAIDGLPDYSEVYAFPNPVKPASHSQVVITGLMANSTVKITDIAGNLINQGVSLGGRYSWNCTNRSGAIVKAGIYPVFATLPDGSQGTVTKIMVLK
jgi:hypothetical protein